MTNQKNFKDKFKTFLDSASKAAGELGQEISRTATKLVGDAKRLHRQTVISVRLDDETVERVEQLVESRICQSRSEAVAFLTKEGIRAQGDLFRRIEEKLKDIRRIHEDLRTNFTQRTPGGFAAGPAPSPPPAPESSPPPEHGSAQESPEEPPVTAMPDGPALAPKKAGPRLRKKEPPQSQ